MREMPRTWPSTRARRPTSWSLEAVYPRAGMECMIPWRGMAGIVSTIGDGLWNAFLMAWEVWWALVLGFLVSAVVQAWVPRARIEASLSGGGPRPVALATGLGAASSSCSYAAVAIAKSLFQK